MDEVRHGGRMMVLKNNHYFSANIDKRREVWYNNSAGAMGLPVGIRAKEVDMRKRVPLREVRMYVEKVRGLELVNHEWVDIDRELKLIDYEWVTGNYVRRIETCSIPAFVEEFMDSHECRRVFNRERGRREIVWRVWN